MAYGADPQIHVFVPVARDGKLVASGETVSVSEALRRLHGTELGKKIADAPALTVVSLADVGALTAWLPEEEVEAILEAGF
jgi:hypothetical protein